MNIPDEYKTILFVEDNPGDVRLTQELFEDKEDWNPTFHIVNDGTEALDFLYQRDDYADAPYPDIILLDWHLPQTDGGEVLKALDEDDTLDDIPVVVQSGSGAELDAIKQERPQADGYILKPLRPEEFIDTVDSL